MSSTRASRTLSVRIERPYEVAHAFLAEPMNWPRWASGLGAGLERLPDGLYRVNSADGTRSRVRFATPNELGVLDHTVLLPDGAKVDVPMRLIRNGAGCELLFTLFQVEGMSDATFASDAAWVERDLATLKALLEGDA